MDAKQERLEAFYRETEIDGEKAKNNEVAVKREHMNIWGNINFDHNPIHRNKGAALAYSQKLADTPVYGSLQMAFIEDFVLGLGAGVLEERKPFIKVVKFHDFLYPGEPLRFILDDYRNGMLQLKGFSYNKHVLDARIGLGFSLSDESAPSEIIEEFQVSSGLVETYNRLSGIGSFVMRPSQASALGIAALLKYSESIRDTKAGFLTGLRLKLYGKPTAGKYSVNLKKDEHKGEDRGFYDFDFSCRTSDVLICSGTITCNTLA